jgi:hypothetical protein
LWKKVISERFKVGKAGNFWGLFFHLQTFRFFPPPFGHSSWTCVNAKKHEFTDQLLELENVNQIWLNGLM